MGACFSAALIVFPCVQAPQQEEAVAPAAGEQGRQIWRGLRQHMLYCCLKSISARQAAGPSDGLFSCLTVSV